MDVFNKTRLAGAMGVEANLEARGLQVPSPPKPAATYVPWAIHQGTIYVAGQIPMVDGKVAYTGKVGTDHSLEEAQKVAETCALNIIAVLKAAAESVGKTLDDVRVFRLSAFVNCAPGFTDIHLVANGASELIGAAFGDDGIHARSAVGMAELPLDVPVEVEAIAAFKD